MLSAAVAVDDSATATPAPTAATAPMAIAARMRDRRGDGRLPEADLVIILLLLVRGR
ncbi:hypothetical protein GCM10009682_15640 [Luedemannella flava]|uniref:Uncharacterized protein n=1 Tax=Luedemannella flava TaxID=349316 RepID=A0ABN2LNS4_9ACTN